MKTSGVCEDCTEAIRTTMILDDPWGWVARWARPLPLVFRGPRGHFETQPFVSRWFLGQCHVCVAAIGLELNLTCTVQFRRGGCRPPNPPATPEGCRDRTPNSNVQGSTDGSHDMFSGTVPHVAMGHTACQPDLQETRLQFNGSGLRRFWP